MIDELLDFCFTEDFGNGDHSTLACVPEDAEGSAILLVKEDGIIAGVEFCQKIIAKFDSSLSIEVLIHDGEHVEKGDIVFKLFGKSRSILTIERLILNFMQRMSGVATKTNAMNKMIAHTQTQLLDTRKTTPGLREVEKKSVRIGGGRNHRMGLYDMIMLKDNHIDYSGGIEKAVTKTKSYLEENNLNLKIEVEVRDFNELKEVIDVGGVDRVMLDNFSVPDLTKALKLIPNHIETEASGGINEETIVAYAETGVQFISVGALTHSVSGLDLSLKADLIV